MLVLNAARMREIHGFVRPLYAEMLTAAGYPEASDAARERSANLAQGFCVVEVDDGPLVASVVKNLEDLRTDTYGGFQLDDATIAATAERVSVAILAWAEGAGIRWPGASGPAASNRP